MLILSGGVARCVSCAIFFSALMTAAVRGAFEMNEHADQALRDVGMLEVRVITKSHTDELAQKKKSPLFLQW